MHHVKEPWEQPLQGSSDCPVLQAGRLRHGRPRSLSQIVKPRGAMKLVSILGCKSQEDPFASPVGFHPRPWESAGHLSSLKGKWGPTNTWGPHSLMTALSLEVCTTTRSRTSEPSTSPRSWMSAEASRTLSEWVGVSVPLLSLATCPITQRISAMLVCGHPKAYCLAQACVGCGEPQPCVQAAWAC